ncbi:uncharacterized protein METZ01_LOCUS195596, partial [marine metagenome]
MKIKYTDKKIYLKNEPEGTIGKSLYAIAEKVRYEKIGSDKLKGIKNNITKCYENKFKNKKIEEIKTEADVPITESFELYMRSHFFKIKPNKTTKKILSYWQDLFDKNLKKKLKELDNCLENQSKFNHIVSEMINNLDFKDTNSKEEEKEAQKNKSSSENDSGESNQASKEEKNQENEYNFNIDDADINSMNENDSLNQNEAEKIKGDPNLKKRYQKNLFKDSYKIFTNEYDEIKEAEELENEEEII